MAKQDFKRIEGIVRSTITKKIVFNSIAVLLPFILLLFIEIGLRIGHYGGDTHLFISAPQHISQYYRVNPNVGARFFAMQSNLPTPSKDLFLKVKPENGLRIFVMGGSTTAGFPYGNNLTFSRMIENRLIEIFPSRKIEVVNVAMSAINSYALLDFTDEILEQKPDLILIYAGHNEYYGALGVGSNEKLGSLRGTVQLFLKLNHLKTFRLIRNAIASVKKAAGKAAYGATESQPNATLMERIVGKKEIPYDSDLYRIGVQQFEENMREIFKKANDASVPVIISELVSNIKDQAPFISIEGDSAFPPAQEIYEKAQILEKEGKLSESKEAYVQAKELDALRFRAPEKMNDIIHALADSFACPVVPMKTIFEEHCASHIPDSTLFLEHLHPNIDGYFLMADAFIQTIFEYNKLGGLRLPKKSPSFESFKRSYGATRLDQVYGELIIRQLKGGWPFQPEGTPNYALLEYQPADQLEQLALEIVNHYVSSIETGHVELANFYQAGKQYEASFKEWNALIYAIPWEEEFYKHALSILLETKNYNEAIIVLKKAIYYQQSPYFEKVLGRLLVQDHRFFEALPYLEASKAAYENDEEIVYLLTVAYFETSKDDQAFDEALLLKKIAPESKYMESVKTLIQINQGKMKAVKALLLKAKQAKGDKNYDAALAILEKCNKVRETFETQFELGQILLIKGRTREALDHFLKAEKIKSSDPENLYHLCTAAMILKEDQLAQTTYKRFMSIHSESPVVLTYQEQLKKVFENRQ